MNIADVSSGSVIVKFILWLTLSELESPGMNLSIEVDFSLDS